MTLILENRERDMQTIGHASIGERPRLVPLVEAEVQAFLVTQYCEPAHHFLWHYHPEAELVWCRQGRGIRYVGQSVEHFGPGDLILLGPNLPHTWASAANQRGDTIWTVVHFLPERWGSEFWKLPETRKLRRTLAQADGGLSFGGEGVWEIGRQIEALARQASPTLAAWARFLQICDRLTETPYRVLNGPGSGFESAEPDLRLNHVLKWIEQNLAMPFTEEQAAAEVGLPPAAFSRWFKARVGCVFRRYVNDLRVAKTCAMLAAGNEGVSEVAFLCGYGSLANFNRRFKEITGMAPTKFRRNLRLMCQQHSHPFVMRLGRNGAVRVMARND